jgi:hypothetical protein
MLSHQGLIRNRCATSTCQLFELCVWCHAGRRGADKAACREARLGYDEMWLPLRGRSHQRQRVPDEVADTKNRLLAKHQEAVNQRTGVVRTN